MTKTIFSIAAVLAAGAMLVAAASPAPAAQPEKYMRAVPAGPATAIRCHRVCVKSGRGTPTHPPACLQWRVVC